MLMSLFGINQYKERIYSNIECSILDDTAPNYQIDLLSLLANEMLIILFSDEFSMESDTITMNIYIGAQFSSLEDFQIEFQQCQDKVFANNTIFIINKPHRDNFLRFPLCLSLS